MGWRVSIAGVLAGVLSLGACSGNAEPEAQAAGILIVASEAFDGTRFVEEMAVLVEDGMISEVGISDDLAESAREVIDLGDSILLPGFIDLHVHLAFVNSYTELVNEGVTTVRDVGTPEDLLPFPESNPLRVVVAGPLITAPGGYPIPIHGRRMGAPIKGADEARAKVRELADKGAGLIKVALHLGRAKWPLLSVSELRAIVDEAHELGLIVTAHVQERVGVDLALAAGVDEFAHMPCSGALGDALWSEVVDAGIEVVATLHALDDGYCRGAGVKAANRFNQAGGKLLYGSDLPGPEIPFGIDVRELELMMEAGLSLTETLAAATSKAGDQLGFTPLGRLEPGAPADLIAVGGDLRSGLETLEDVLFVMKGGAVVVNAEDDPAR